MIQRQTIQCLLVYQTVNRLHFHPTADEVYDEIVKNNPNISRATVYRNLNRLALEHKIRKVAIPGSSADRFDYRLDNHYHFKCNKCGRVFDVNEEDVRGLKVNIINKHGFEYDNCDIVFNGLCPDCQKHK